MQAPRIKEKKGPEAKIQSALIDFLKLKGWNVLVTHGNIYQQGLPDLFCCHPRYGLKLIEVKNPLSFSFTAAQRIWFPIFDACHLPLYVLVAATEEEYKKLFGPRNWATYMYFKRAF